MKVLFVAALIAISGVNCGPISVSDNNIGDIITLGVNVEANVKSDINVAIINVLVALLANIGDLPPPPPPPPFPTTTVQPSTTVDLPSTTLSPEPIIPNMHVDDMIRAIQDIKQRASAADLTKEQKEQIWRENAEQFAKQLLTNRH